MEFRETSTSHLGQVRVLLLTDCKMVVARGKRVRLFSSMAMSRVLSLVVRGGEVLRG